LTLEPEIIAYSDNTFALSWWPHYIYRIEDDMIFNHEEYASGNVSQDHKKYLERELKYKQYLQT